MKTTRHRPPIRLILTFLIILAELYLLVLSVTHLSEQRVWIYSAAELLAIITAISIINKRGNPSYKIMWIFFILLVPLFGVLAYLLWGGGRVMPHINRRMQRCINKYSLLLPNDDKTASHLNYSDMIHFRQAEYIRLEANAPVYDGTESEFLSPGEKLMPRLLEELKKAGIKYSVVRK